MGAQPTAEDLVRAMEEAVPRIPHVDCAQFHQRVRAMYSWENVAERTERVYERIYKQPKLPLIERFRRYYGCGPMAGKLFVLVVALDYLLLKLLEWLRPADGIDVCLEFPFIEHGADHSARHVARRGSAQPLHGAAAKGTTEGAKGARRQEEARLQAAAVGEAEGVRWRGTQPKAPLGGGLAR